MYHSSILILFSIQIFFFFLRDSFSQPSGDLNPDLYLRTATQVSAMHGQVFSKDNCYESGHDFQRLPEFTVVVSGSPGDMTGIDTGN